MQGNYQQLVKEAEQVLRDEGMYRSYQERLGIKRQPLETVIPPTELIKQLPNVELSPDMSITEAQDRFNRALQERDRFHLDNTKKAVSEAVSAFKEEIYKEIGASMKPMHKAKWKTAMDAATSKYGPALQEVRSRLVAMIDGPYASHYTGENESDLIEKVFRAEFPDNYAKHIVSQNAAQRQTIVDAGTAIPSKQMTTLPSDSSPSSCIARANARVEASLRAKGLL